MSRTPTYLNVRLGCGRLRLELGTGGGHRVELGLHEGQLLAVGLRHGLNLHTAQAVKKNDDH
jgi:hypothetical protein